MVKRKKSL